MTPPDTQAELDADEAKRTRGLSPAGRRLRQMLLDIYSMPAEEWLRKNTSEQPETWVD